MTILDKIIQEKRIEVKRLLTQKLELREQTK